MLDLRAFIRDVPDFPKPGIVFKDITPLLANPSSLALAVEVLCNPFRGQGIQAVIGAESRGFIFGTAIAQALSCGFVPVRKPGKLPAQKLSLTYDLEYGQDTLEIHKDAIKRGEKCLMVDDLLATGGTMKACCDLIESLGGQIVGIAVLIELTFLKGRARFEKYHLHSAIRYDT
jgi:adenine phosphoribosyltransferase